MSGDTAPRQPSDQEICEAYGYVMGRLLVLRQQRLDFEREGLDWNRLVHRERGDVAWVNPNLDVVYSEAWVAVDHNSCVLLEIPRIEGRYYTWHMLNGWGETVLNINERTYPHQPYGRYALCLEGSAPPMPDDALRIDLPAKVTRVLARIEIGADPEAARRLQHAFVLTPFGRPATPASVAVPAFTNRELPGVEAFDLAAEILAANDDINPGMEGPRASLAAVAELTASEPAARESVHDVVMAQARKELRRHMVTAGQIENGWTRMHPIGNYGDDYWTRTVCNLGGLWANNTGECAALAAMGLDGSTHYTQTYPRDRLPGDNVDYYWSITAVDSREFRVIPNPLDRHVLNGRSPLEYDKDGSLTLVFAPERPTAHPETNWLPTRPGITYNLTYRLYGPKADAANGRYRLPPLAGTP
ncbi:DUF1214 domain-containing protein [Streptomyces albipurpureus]|uniref:DUF1214 domain-containing protein n=1 Tax=Streptomyces albipurpureus TaxID=2897419 RepID=A0ABT0UJH2_9ACTN|nr:DUF1214 domain-containing protein [Streptomyces sp. CWNU-1]MCM2387563.1 DUF1214 domain-containing protein [Streptomyces sp. CWNU-1]